MKKETWLSLFFVALLGGGLVWSLLTPDREYSESENRYLQTLPRPDADQIFSGKFGSQFESYITDQIPARDGWVALKTITQLGLGRPDNGRVYFGEKDRLFAVPEEADEAWEERNCRAVAAFLRRAKENRPSLRVSVLLAPTASTVLPEDLPALAPVADEEALVDRMRAALEGVALFYTPAQALKAQSDRESLYFRTDHHWTVRGAYVAYAGWADAMGLEARPLADFTAREAAGDFYGTLFSKANLPWIRPDPLEALEPPGLAACSFSTDGGKTFSDGLYDEEALKGRDKYTYFLGGNHPLTVVRTGTASGRRLLVVKDSYAHSFVPFLTEHYETIYLLDPRYFKGDIQSWMEEQAVTDVLVLYNAATFSADRQLAAVLQPRT